MSPNESIAEVFLMALKSMSEEQKDAVLVGIAQDEEFREDLQDLIIFETRKDEETVSFREYLAQKKSWIVCQ